MTTPARTRRTQAERRAATRGALLDATIDCLVEYGYAGATTTLIAERAGVTRGAQAHHFATKAELVTEALRHLAARLGDEYRDLIGRTGRGDGAVAGMLDRLWELHTGPFFAAAVELWLAARTDPELRKPFAVLEAEVLADLRSALTTAFPDFAARPAIGRALFTTMAAIRGVALLVYVHDADVVDKEWHVTRAHLVDLWAAELAR